ncbi:MAG: tRNA (adenosine(37)-N6)-threonylcarbamoyltransferase complex ATPase subunit type 1 TsaE [Ignavibacteria bacterium]|nr:tRNA (adenosine(37)-N6)-threonylcarbamoyltransferase complex ATPase subunit type 1 TsaE [Ignavibacteria bacterium]MCC7157958.1 tRNA (adenosine(37)-N6)-threonylcarbamoyltransferase complex ATPase subunit type 1 TsaE [Ignavibacteria bacterium]
MIRDFAVTTNSAEETQKFGFELAKSLNPGSIVAMFGDLGSGKTQIVKGVCNALGVKQTVNSPTFIIVNEYTASDSKLIYHFDLYRMRSLDEILEMGFKEYLDENSIVLIEWPEKVEDILPANAVKIHIAHTVENENARWIKMEKPD